MRRQKPISARIGSLFRGILLVSLLVGWATPPAIAQVTTGTISGTVTDERGAVLPGVSVTITHVATGTTRTLTTDDHGRYRAPRLPVGEYEIRATHEGFQSAIRRNIVLTLGREVVVDIVMKVGQITEEIVVTGGARLVNTTNATISGLIDPEQIRNLPLNGRSFADLSVLEAGVTLFTNALSSDATGAGFGGSGVRLVMNGIRPELNNILIDGIDALDAFGNAPGSAAGVLLGVDTIQEFETITGTYSAEYGRAAGGVINAVTRSGTNEFHGSVFEFLRNDNLDARNFFDLRDKPEFKRNQFGFTLGGPILRDRTFFFTSYEGLRERLGVTRFARVPTAEARQGNLPSGAIEVNSAVRPFLDLFPLPNGRDFGDGTGEFIFGVNLPTDEDFYVVKIDHQISDRQSLFVRYSIDDAERQFPPLGSLFGADREMAFSVRESRQQLATIQHTGILSPQWVNTFRFGFNRATIVELNFPERFRPDLSFFVGDNTGMGAINVQGLSLVGNTSGGAGHTIQNEFQVSDDVSYTTGSHGLKLGFVAKRFQYNDNRLFQDKGQFVFDGLVNFLQGIPVSFIKDIPGSDYTSAQRFSVFGFYVQDDWRATSRLTVNLGFRYEFMTTPQDELKPVRNFKDPLHDAEASVVSNKPIQNPSLKNFMPRIGFAWDPFGDGKTSIRGGFGIFFQQLTEANLNFVFRLSQPPVKTVLIGGPPARRAFPKAPIPDPFKPVIVFPLEYDAKSPYTMQWNLTIERELLPDVVFTIGYVGNRGVHLAAPAEINFNRREILSDGRAFFPPGRPQRMNPNFAAINIRDFGSDSWYHGLQVRVRKQMSHGFQMQASYTFSKAIDNAPPILRDLENSPTILFDWFQRDLDKSLSGFDVRNNFVFNFSYELPIGPDRAWGSDLRGFAGKLLEGWQINGILTLASGNPFTVENAFDRARTFAIGPFRHDRPNVKPGASNNPKIGSPDRWFDPNAFELQPAGFLGNLGRNTLIGPGLANFDFSLFKTTSIGEKVDIQFRTEIFNIFNRANFATPDRPFRFVFLDPSGIPSGAAGRITKTSTTSRQIQFGLKILF
ncbi:MAG: TonB-dependent receptor [Acidobacteria bacterium]|nr:MAG: TonB-dependent receptor [Acidobacteriota bacterium]